MGLVDTLMVGPLGPAAIGAVGLGSIVFLAIGIFGMGLLLGLDTLVAQSFGAGRLDRCQHWLRQGVYLALISAVPLSLLAFGVTATLPLWGLNAEVLVIASPYLNVVTLSVLPLLLYAAFRRYLQAVNLVRPITFALLSANLVNVARELGADLRQVRVPGSRRDRRGMGDGALARLHGGGAVRGRPRSPPRPRGERAWLRAAWSGRPCAGSWRSAARRASRFCSRSACSPRRRRWRAGWPPPPWRRTRSP